MKIKRVKWLFLVFAVAMASAALAGPAQDTELAEEAFNAEDLPKAMELFRKAALQSYAPAQVRYAEILDSAEENEAAVSWYKIAIEQGSAAGEMGLGTMYLKGEGVKKDEEKAFHWIQRATEQNYLPAVEFLVSYYRGKATFWEDRASFLKARAAEEKAAAEKAAAEKASDKPGN